MRRREFMKNTVVASGVLAAGGGVNLSGQAGVSPEKSLTPPDSGPIRIAFLISKGATVIDFTGPWEVFQDVHVPERGDSMEEMMPFRLYTVSATREPVRCSGGLQVVPNHDFSSAPAPQVVVVPAQGGADTSVLSWLTETAARAQLTMSVCTGAFVLARAGLLNGKPATTHHDFFDRFEKEFPEVELKRDQRFVESGSIATAAGLTSGIDLALRVVERYFGRRVAENTARYMEYSSRKWRL